MLKQLDTIEEYLLVICGQPAKQSSPSVLSWNATFNPIIKLARCDVSVLENFLNQVTRGIGFTARQADLAAKIICKYERQLSDKGFDVEPVKSGSVTFKTPVRSVNYERRISVSADSNQFIAVFPFNEELITAFREYKKVGNGLVEWDQTTRQWHLALTEGNLMWLLDIAAKFNVVLDPSMDQYIDTCKQAVDITPTLRVVNGKVVMDYFPETMVNFVTSKLGDLELSKIEKIADYAPICQFSIDDSVVQYLPTSAAMLELLLSRTVKYPVIEECHPEIMQNLCAYIKRVNRYPVIVFDPNQLSNQILSKPSLAQSVIGSFGVDGVTFFNDSIADDLDTYKVIITNTFGTALEKLNSIGLLISGNGLMLNTGRRQLTVQKAEKIVYFAHHVTQHGNN